MFKKICSMIIAVGCLFGAFALAEFDPEAPDAFIESSCRYLYGSNNFVRGTYDQGDILYDASGKALTAEGAYHDINAFNADYLLAGGFDGHKGVLSADGTELVPVKYDAVYVRGNWAIGFVYEDADEDDYDLAIENGDDTRYVICNQADVYSLKNGACVETAGRGSYADSAAGMGCLNIEDTDGNIRSYDEDGTIHEDVASYLSDFEWCPSVVDVYYDDDGYLSGLCDADGNPLCDAVYGYIAVEPGMTYFQVEDESGMYGLIRADGTEVIAPAFTEIMNIGYGLYETCGIFAAINDDDGTVTLIDSVNGDEYTIDMSDFDQCDFDGCALMVHYDDGTSGVIASDGTETILPEDLDWTSIGRGVFTATDYDNGCVVAVNAYGETLITGGDILMTPDGHLVVDVDGGLMIFAL